MNEPAVKNSVQDNKRKGRIGSGRIVGNNYIKDNNCYSYGMDQRFMQNDLFIDSSDVKHDKNRKNTTGSGIDFNWNNKKNLGLTRNDNDNMNAKSDEPEWANCKVSKNDIIELHGFDGPINDGENTNKPNEIKSAVMAPARSTPSKMKNNDEHFNFEEFLKLDLPNTVNGARETDNNNGGSRFTQWFGRNNSTNTNESNANHFDGKALANNGSTQQFFNYYQRASLKEGNAVASTKFRCVDELEAALQPNQSQIADAKAKPSQQSQQHIDFNAFQTLLNQIALQSTIQQKSRAFDPAQLNYLVNLMLSNKNNNIKTAEDLYKQSLSKNAAMQRPDAQLLLHRLVNGETNQYRILQQISNPVIHQRDRETYIAVLK